jgi:hypothetical protein
MIDKATMYVLPLRTTQTLYNLLSKVSLQITSPSFKEDADILYEAKVELEKILKYYQTDNTKPE